MTLAKTLARDISLNVGIEARYALQTLVCARHLRLAQSALGVRAASLNSGLLSGRPTLRRPACLGVNARNPHLNASTAATGLFGSASKQKGIHRPDFFEGG